MMNHIPMYRLFLAGLLSTVFIISGCFILPEQKVWTKDPQQISMIRNQLLIPGEKLSYTINTGIFKLGHAELTIKVAKQDINKIALSLLATSTHPWMPSRSYVYKSIANKDTFATDRYQMEEMEKSDIMKSVSFEADYSKHTGTYSLQKRKKTYS